ncbi:MAG: exopolyphosphatase [Rhodothermaceae bacterium]|nr:MAG: exopolyphosphatase [Rhodothermaceae bacterium]
MSATPPGDPPFSPESAMRLATIDVGTNTALLLVAEQAPGGRLRVLYEESRVIRLGEGVDRSRVIRPEAMARLRDALLAYRHVADTYGVQATVVAGTSASRDAENRDELVAFVRRETGLAYEILSGDEEARWSFAGAVSAFDDLRGPCIVFDIGGGSTEVVEGEAGPDGTPRLTFRTSLDVGTVRLAERYFATQPPPAGAVAAVRAALEAAFSVARLPGAAGRPLIGAAGTAVVLALLHRGLSAWPPGGVTLTRADVVRWRRRLLAATYDEVLALNPALMTGRADVFPTGVLLFEALMRHTGAAACRVSPRSLRHGLALRFFHQNGLR